MNKRNKILKYWSTRSKKKNLKCKFHIQIQIKLNSYLNWNLAQVYSNSNTTSNLVGCRAIQIRIFFNNKKIGMPIFGTKKLKCCLRNSAWIPMRLRNSVL